MIIKTESVLFYIPTVLIAGVFQNIKDEEPGSIIRLKVPIETTNGQLIYIKSDKNPIDLIEDEADKFLTYSDEAGISAISKDLISAIEKTSTICRIRFNNPIKTLKGDMKYVTTTDPFEELVHALD